MGETPCKGGDWPPLDPHFESSFFWSFEGGSFTHECTPPQKPQKTRKWLWGIFVIIFSSLVGRLTHDKTPLKKNQSRGKAERSEATLDGFLGVLSCV